MECVGAMVCVQEVIKKDSKGFKTTVEVWQVGCVESLDFNSFVSPNYL